MRHSASSHRDTSTFFSRGRTLVVAAMIGVSTVIAPGAWAQDAASPEASPAATPLRITLEPGASTPMHTHPGPEFNIIEQGELTIRTEGDAPVTRADGTEEVSSGEDIVLATGDWIMFPPETGMYYINEGEDAVEMLSAVMLPVGTAYPQSITYTDGQPTSQDFAGVSFVVLGDGLIQEMPDAPVEVTINDVVLPAGVDLPGTDGIAMYSAVDGNFSFIVDDGLVQVSRSELASLQPNAVTGEEFILEEGDAAFFPAGVEAAPRANEPGDVHLLTLEMSFAEAMDRDPAQLTFTSGASASGDGTGVAESVDVEGTPEAGSQLGTVNADNVNLRAEPSTSADVVDQISSGVEVEIIGGPTDAEDITWYEIRVNVEGGSQGWMSADFIDVASTPAEETEETDAEPTAEVCARHERHARPATEDATDGTDAEAETRVFTSGDTVQLTDDNVRVRAEGNLGADIINTFPAGTQFEVTGDPIDADSYTWYPVTSVDDAEVSGWVTADFLEAAP